MPAERIELEARRICGVADAPGTEGGHGGFAGGPEGGGQGWGERFFYFHFGDADVEPGVAVVVGGAKSTQAMGFDVRGEQAIFTDAEG